MRSEASTAEPVTIHYHRPPDREDVFVQRLVERTGSTIITFMERTPLARTLRVRRRIALENGSPVVWFTFPGCWHDIGLFHRADGRYTGTYANILTPVRLLDATTWSTTDLFLDVWVDLSGEASILDEDEFRHAIQRGWLEPGLAARARAEAELLLRAARAGEWPPPVVRDWTLDRVRSIPTG